MNPATVSIRRGTLANDLARAAGHVATTARHLARPIVTQGLQSTAEGVRFAARYTSQVTAVLFIGTMVVAAAGGRIRM